MRSARPLGKAGQVIVETLLILPIYLMIVFTVLEMGNIAFQIILVNHVSWETARIGSMKIAPRKPIKHLSCGMLSADMGMLQAVISAALDKAKVVSAGVDTTGYDRQAEGDTCDLVLITEYPIGLIFPGPNIALARPPGSGTRVVQFETRMPIEAPLAK